MSDLQPQNVLRSILVMRLGKVTDESFEQSEKAPSPILVTLLGIIIVESDLHLLKK